MVYIVHGQSVHRPQISICSGQESNAVRAEDSEKPKVQNQRARRNGARSQRQSRQRGRARDIQMRPNSLLGRKMVYKSPGNAQSAIFFRSAASTRAIRFDRAKILAVARMLQIEHAARCDGVAEALFMPGIISATRKRRARPDKKLTAVLVGHTQSNISAPRATATTISSG